MNKKTKNALFTFAVAAVGVLSAAVSLYQFTVGSGCLFLAITGLPCPTCGMTRATVSLICLRFTEAFGYHPLFWAPYSMVALGLTTIPLKRWRRRIVYALVALVIAFIAVWIIRVACFGWRG